jgi:hypothetical protein
MAFIPPEMGLRVKNRFTYSEIGAYTGTITRKARASTLISTGVRQAYSPSA